MKEQTGNACALAGHGPAFAKTPDGLAGTVKDEFAFGPLGVAGLPQELKPLAHLPVDGKRAAFSILGGAGLQGDAAGREINLRPAQGAQFSDSRAGVVAGYTAPGYECDGIGASNLDDGSLSGGKWTGFFLGARDK